MTNKDTSKKHWDQISQVGQYAEYVRTETNKIMDFIKSDKVTIREFKLSPILDNRVHPILSELNEISEYINSLIFLQLEKDQWKS